MITGGALKQEKLILTTATAKDASMARSGLAGKNMYISTAPYGNKTDLATEGSNLILTKSSGAAFTYEEIRTLIKKIQMFDRISKKNALNLLDSARQRLDSRLTIFFPDLKQPSIEVTFSYNWISMEVDSERFAQVYKVIRNIVTKNEPSSIKVFCNEKDIISIHNYAMQGIYVSRKTFEAIIDVFVENGIIREEQKILFITRLVALQVASVSYMEARMLCQNIDQNFDFKKSKNYSSIIGSKEFLEKIMDIFVHIFKQGHIEHLNPQEIKYLQNLANSPDNLEEYNLAETIDNSIRRFLEDFSGEINIMPNASN